MALEKHSFIKIVPITLTGPEVAAGEATRTFSNTRMEDATTVKVYFNGQLIPGGLLPVTPDSRFYYEITRVLNPPTVDLNASSVPADSSSVMFRLAINQNYRGPGYVPGSGFSELFSSTDTFAIAFYYDIYTVK